MTKKNNTGIKRSDPGYFSAYMDSKASKEEKDRVNWFIHKDTHEAIKSFMKDKGLKDIDQALRKKFKPGKKHE